MKNNKMRFLSVAIIATFCLAATVKAAPQPDGKAVIAQSDQIWNPPAVLFDDDFAPAICTDVSAVAKTWPWHAVNSTSDAFPIPAVLLTTPISAGKVDGTKKVYANWATTTLPTAYVKSWAPVNNLLTTATSAASNCTVPTLANWVNHVSLKPAATSVIAATNKDATISQEVISSGNIGVSKKNTVAGIQIKKVKEITAKNLSPAVLKKKNVVIFNKVLG